MKLKTLSAIVLALSAVPAGANTCGIHDHLCRAHGLGAAHGSVNRDRNAPTGAVIYMQKTDTNAPNTDVDNHVLGAATDKNGRSNGSFNPTYTDYGARNPSRLAEWDTPDTKNRHIYGSAYANQFNNGQALAVHTGDFDGGENGKIPNATGCPTVLGSSKQNCEAVIITGNMPSGVYSQKAEMFNYHGVANPKADLTMGAYATGNMALISRSHAATSNGVAVGKAGNRVEHHTTLSGHGAKTQQYDYEFVNRGHKGHGAGTTTHNHLHNPARTHEPLRVTTEKLLVNTGKHEIPNFARYDAEQARNSLTVPDDPRVTVKRQPSPMLPETQQGRKGKGTPMATPAGFDVASNSTHNVPNLTDEQVVKQAKEWLSDKMPEHGKQSGDIARDNPTYQPNKPRSDDELVIKNPNQNIKSNSTVQNDFLLDTPEETCSKRGIGCDNLTLKQPAPPKKPPVTAPIKGNSSKDVNNGEKVEIKTNIEYSSAYGSKKEKDKFIRMANLLFRTNNKVQYNAEFAKKSYVDKNYAKECKDTCTHTGVDFQGFRGKQDGNPIKGEIGWNGMPIYPLTTGKAYRIKHKNGSTDGAVIVETILGGEEVRIGYVHLEVSPEIPVYPKSIELKDLNKPIGKQSNLLQGLGNDKTTRVHLHLEMMAANDNNNNRKVLDFVLDNDWDETSKAMDIRNPLDYIDEIEEKYFTIKN